PKEVCGMKPTEKKILEDKPADDQSGCNLVAAGRSGNWTVFVDETPAGRPQKWFLQISGPYLYLSCEIQSLAVVNKLHRYLTRTSPYRAVSDKPSDRVES